jgi:predicted TIM-barrel fold metal-dependent hydrolase
MVRVIMSVSLRGIIGIRTQRTVGADNIMFAIDYPYERTEDAVGFIRTAPLEADDMAKITHRNAERIFGIAAA